MTGLIELPMFPLGRAVLPGEFVPLRVFEPRYLSMFEWLIKQGTEQIMFGTVMIQRGSEVGGGDVRSAIGLAMQARDMAWSEDRTRAALIAEGTEVFEVVDWLPEATFPRAIVDMRAPSPESVDGPFAISYSAAAAVVRELRGVAFESGASIDPTVVVGDAHGSKESAAWTLCRLAPLDDLDRYKLLRVVDPTDRLIVLNALCQDRTETFRFGLS